jgi:hypothetical protein
VTTSLSTTGTAVGTNDHPTTYPLPRPGHVGRRLAAVGLVVGAALNTTEAVLGQLLPDPDGVAGQLAGVAEHTLLFGTRAVLGTLAVPFMALAFVAVAQRLGLRARRTGYLAGGLLLAGMWGFVGIHLVTLLQLPAARLADPAGAVALLEATQQDPVLGLLFMAPFLIGCALGMVVLTVGLLVTRAVPRWTAAAWLVFILLDFSIGAVGPVDPHWLFLAGAVGLAVHLLRHEAPSGRTVH